MNISTTDTVILLIPAGKQKTEEVLNSILEVVKGLPIIEGQQDYSAVVFDPPANPEEEDRLAKSISKKLDGTVYSLWTYDDESKNVHHFKNGKKLKSEYQDLLDFTLDLGIELPGLSIDEEIPDILKSISLFKGNVGLSEIESCIAEEYDESELVDVLIKKQDDLILIYNANGDTDHFVLTLFDRYDLEAETCKINSIKEFFYYREKNFEELGCYIYPIRTTDVDEEDQNILKSVNGKTRPIDILKSLKIDPALFPDIEEF